MKNGSKLPFTSLSALLIVIALSAIISKSHTVSSRFEGVRTIVGNDAVWFGQTCFILALLPLLVWLPKRWIGYAVSAWWVTLMIWLFGPFFLR